MTHPTCRFHTGRRRTFLLFLLLGVASPAASQDRVLWRFEMDSAISGAEMAVGPDGTIYASDNTKLYALKPDGDVKWTRAGIGGGTPISFLADGTIITGLGVTVRAIDPADGSDVWTFQFDGGGTEQIEVGPSIGPDGNIYGVTSVEGGFGLGVFSLTSAGNLRWSHPGDPPLDLINGTNGGPVYFTSERLIFPFNFVQAGGPYLYGFDFQGEQTMILDSCTGVPRIDSLDRLIVASQCGIRAHDQDGTVTHWTVYLGAVHLTPTIGADATVYSGAWMDNVHAIAPDGTILWSSGGGDLAVQMLAVRQDTGIVVYGGSQFGTPWFVSGLATADGEVVWRLDLLTIDGQHEIVQTKRAPTSLDGSTVYFATRFTSNGAPGAVYAVHIGHEPPSGVEEDGQHTLAPRKGMNLRALPNPVSGAAWISFELVRAAQVDLTLHDAAGRRITTILEHAPLDAGRHRIEARLPDRSGVYFVRLSTGRSTETRKVIRTE